MTEENCFSTPVASKIPNTEMEFSPSGTFSLSDLSKLIDSNLEPILEQLHIIGKALTPEQKVSELEAENKILKEKLLSQETYSRKNNNKPWGIKETKNENCEQVLLHIGVEVNTWKFKKAEVFWGKKERI